MVKSMKMHKMQNALSARLMVNMEMVSDPAIQHPAILMYEMLVPDNYGHTGSVEELQSNEVAPDVQSRLLRLTQHLPVVRGGQTGRGGGVPHKPQRLRAGDKACAAAGESMDASPSGQLKDAGSADRDPWPEAPYISEHGSYSRQLSSASGHNEAGTQIQVCKPAAGGFWGSSSGNLWHLNIM
ncbi:LOW QUALITY PROTEIN: uncharacterized protein Dere_GG27033 [Drosophila erecta]|uniref:Uncharacterized protein n=1 Tax=Drosophila erecta TaxID=7220 RepID=A0A0Q5U662_DROER|nr:LOW QUALITY PROTEIN: uncharacterized protein Dere_GG27033 [Drosophila erecta]